ncbi:START domain-containing protein 10 [Puntigrus tetrazona]|uniref:START domain-containing protein 10 n=1 Tax=Puntigrus tetrazona TaxID=1606681 RepID=UPI001C8963F3|nr:START domain-containing protein 10 [Puntigrus tetrazona]
MMKTKMSEEEVLIPDDRAFGRFKHECESEEDWTLTYNKNHILVWVQVLEEEKSLHRIKCRMQCKDIPAETMYDVLHDIEYRRKWDANVIETFDIGKLTVNADVGYYSWKCPKPLKNRDVITLRSWLPMGNDYIIMNYSVKHAKYPPKKDSCAAHFHPDTYTDPLTLSSPAAHTTYLAQVDPRGSLPKWVVNKSSQFLAPKAMKRISKACLRYPEWKQKHSPGFKPWLFPEQNPLSSIPLSELSIQHAESLENIDESSLSESKEERAEHSDDEGAH